MSNILTAIQGFFSATWGFLMGTFIPGTEIAFGVVFIGLAVIGLGFRFLSLALGVTMGEPPDLGSYTPSSGSGLGLPFPSTRYRISDGRKNDVR